MPCMCLNCLSHEIKVSEVIPALQLMNLLMSQSQGDTSSRGVDTSVYLNHDLQFRLLQ